MRHRDKPRDGASPVRRPWFRFTTRRILAATAFTAVLIGSLPSGYHYLRPGPTLGAGLQIRDYDGNDLEPFVTFALLPASTLLLSAQTPKRWLLKAAIALNLGYLLARALIRDAIVGPGSAYVCPDDLIAFSSLGSEWWRYRLHLVFLGANLKGETQRQSINLIQVLMLLTTCVAALVRRARWRIRLAVVLVVNGWSSCEWVMRMRTSRILNEMPRWHAISGWGTRGPVSWMDFYEVILLSSLLTYLLYILADSLRCSPETERSHMPVTDT